MWGPKLCVLLLLGTHTLAQQDAGNVEEQSPVCFLAKRYKNFRRFVYDYEAETFNGVTGATDNKSGPKVSCKVEIDVPQTCSFIVRTTKCSLSEIFDVDAEGSPVYRPAAGAQAFAAAMEKNILKVTVEGLTDVKLFPEVNEPVNILNIKRGIVSALLVPVMEEEKNAQMPTVHGVCDTDFTVNQREDIAVDVTVNRDLSKCDSFEASRQTTSPLALISGMNIPLSQLISSTQTCSYQFDNQKKHMTSGTCTEKHIFLPLSHKNEYGISAMVKQTLTLRDLSKINDRIFEPSNDRVESLPMDAADDKSSVQTTDAVITTMQTLSSLSQTGKGEQRAGLFTKLVSELRGLDTDTLSSATVEMMDISSALTFQALVQCGTPECTSAMLKILRTFDDASLEVDAVVYALALLPEPSPLLVKDMLAMAQYKQSKPIMYALSNVARKLYEAQGETPEVTAVAEFLSSLLGADCAGEKDLVFLTLRVVGNMGRAMEAVDPAIKTTLLKCMRQPATTLSVQLAAIQAFRRMSVTDEVRANLQRVSQYPKGAVQKRLAAYLMLMRNPQDSDIEMVKKLLTQEQNVQIKSFVTSHIYNIISSKAAETRVLRQKIMDALQDTDIVTNNDYTTMSRNYKLGLAQEHMAANIQGNIIFDPSSQLPREVLLETTLSAFGYSIDIWELGMEGKGFEPSIEALFGKNGFFPDTVSKALYWAEDKMSPKIREVLEKWTAPLKSEEHKVPENLMREIGRNFNKLVKDLQSQESTEAMAYLRLMGAELGYIKSSELRSVAESAAMYSRVLLKILPTEFMTKLVSQTNNEIFAHYIFMDNKFTLPTASGMPLKFALSGTFTPGAIGGLRLSRNMNELIFMPSVGVEFRTQMGIHLPAFVAAAVEMQTSMYHESALNAKITMEENQVKLSIPAPQGTTKFLRISNKVMIVDSGAAAVIPHSVGATNCGSLFSGIRYCTKMLRADTGDRTDIPYFPLNGETSYAFDIKPSSEVSEYTATIAYELLSEGKDGRHKVDSLKMILRAEGSQPTEATATMKYNRNRNVFTTQIEVPDFDIEAGIKVGISDSSAKGKTLTLELTNKNVPQISLIGRAKLQAMTDGMVEVQLLVPSLKTDATVTATMSNAGGLTMELKSDVKLPEISSVQAVIFKYGEEQVEVQLVSNMNADTKVPMHYAGDLQAWTGQFAEDVMDQQVPNTDMKVRHIGTKGFEAYKIWMQKFSKRFPAVARTWDQMIYAVISIDLPSVPENLFMNLDSTFKYKFNGERLAITVPLPLGGKSSEELRVPAEVTSPEIFMPQLGVEFASRKFQIPTFTIPAEYDITLPLLGLMEASTKVNSNFYNWEATASAGNMTVDSPSYLAKFNIKGESPYELLSFSVEGSTSVTDTEENKMEVTIDSSLKHNLMKTGFNVLETIAVRDNVLFTGRYHVYANSPVGLDTSLTVTTQFTLDSNMLFGDLNTDGSVTVGPMTASTTYLHTFSVEPVKKEAKMESTLRVNSEILNIGNKVKASFVNNELLFESNSNVNSGPVRHTTKINLSYKDVKLTITCDSVTKALERMLRSQLEFSSFEGKANLRIENQADDAENRAYSLLTGSLNPSGLEISADASVNFFSSLASHKATLELNANGLTTSCTTTAQHSPLTFENVFHSGVDASGATLSLTTKAAIKDNKAELNVEGKLASTEVYLNSIFKGNLFDIDSRNRVNFRLNENGLVLSNNLVGSFQEMRTENDHSLSLTLRSFTLNSKTDNFLNERNSYMHEINVNMERFTASVVVKNDLKVMDINFANSAQFKAEPYNIEMTGTMMGAFSEEELKHIYEIKFVDMVLSAMCNTNGKLLGTHLTHTTEMEVAGLTMKFNNAANFNSPYLRMDSTVKTVAEPFILTIDALFNSDGGLYLYGQQSGNLYSKFLLKAEPLLFTQSFEYKASTTHKLEDRPIIKTTMDNKFTSMLSLQEQSIKLRMTSKVNEQTFNQEFDAYNNAVNMGIEMAASVSAPIFSENMDDYSISAFVKYDKNSDSHSIQIPFIERMPEVIENMRVTLMRLMDQSIEMLKDINTKFEISEKFQAKMTELKVVIDEFNFNLFIEDLRKFLRSIEDYITNLTDKFPTEKVIEVLNAVKDTVMAWLDKYDIPNKFNAIYTKMDEFLSSYDIEKFLDMIVDEMIEIMKQYQVKEKIRHVFRMLKSIDIQPLLEKVMTPVQELVNELYSFDIKQLIDDVSDYFLRIIQKVRSFDYDTFTMELKDKVVEMSQIPCFGKLYGGFTLSSPHYNLRSTADLENTTTTSVTPEFKMNLNSQAESTLKVLDFILDASATFAAPEKSQLTITENIKVDQSSITLDHKGEMTIYGLTRAAASAETNAKVATELYKAEFVNNAGIQVENKLSATMDTTYKHYINMPFFNIVSDANMDQKTELSLEDWILHLNFINGASEKIAVRDFSDEGTHKSTIDVVMDSHTMKLTFTGETGSNYLKLIQNVITDICLLNHVKFDAKLETETPFMKGSIAEIKFQADAGDLKIDFTASHSAELVGQVEGTLSTTAVASVTPDELMFDTKNKGNAKLSLPFRLSGKVDLQNDIAFLLNPVMQQASWTGLARFNQYKYSHNFAIDNNEREISLLTQINGEANLDMLEERFTVPQITLPLIGMKTPRMEDFSLWHDTLLKHLLITTEQAFDMDAKLKYTKNPEMKSFDVNMKPIYNVIGSNMEMLQNTIVINKDKAADIFAAYYGKAEAELEKYDMELPKTIKFPAFKVPLFNKEVSSFTVQLPDYTTIQIPSLRVPSMIEELSRMSLPNTIKIKIPTLGGLIYEFSMKTAMLTLKTDASILNGDDITMKLDASSTSKFRILTGKIVGNTVVVREAGLKMISDLLVEAFALQGNHGSTIILSSDNADISINNLLKCRSFCLVKEIHQELTGNLQEGVVVSMSSPSAGHLALHMQAKRPAQMRARLYGRYPSEPTTDIEILGLKMSVVDSEKMNLQTTWNTELPLEVMLTLKDEMAKATVEVFAFNRALFNEFNGFARSLTRKSKTLFKRAVESLAEADPSEMLTTFADDAMQYLEKIQSKVEIVVNAVIRLLRDTTFQIPGYTQRLSGLEIYQTLTRFVADVSEEAVQKIPGYFTSWFAAVIEYFQNLEFILPGSDYIVSGREILDDLLVALRKIQDKIILILRKFRTVQLNEILENFSAFTQFAVEQNRKLVETLKSQNVEKISTFVSDVYNDAVNSDIFSETVRQIEEAHNIVLEYLTTLRTKVNEILSKVSLDQLKNDITSWLDSLLKSLYTFHNNVIAALKEKSKSVEPYVRVGDRELEVDIPLPVVRYF